MTPKSASERVRTYAQSIGFQRVGFADAAPLTIDHDRYRQWLQDKHHGEMSWLADNVESRRGVNTPLILDGAKSLIVCAMSYLRADEPCAQRAVIARYARGRDYHNFLRRRLRKLATWLRTKFSVEARPMVDTAPVLERAWAARAAVGFVGKNACVISPGIGSFVLLGEVATTLELAADEPIAPRCGQCTLCLEECPTRALVEPFVLDARRCVSYLTIEFKGSVPEELRAPIGDRIFGCDDCLSVCPFNRARAPAEESTRDFRPDQRWSSLTPEAWLTMSPHDFQVMVQGSAIRRAGRESMARNAAIVLGNTGDRRHMPALRHAITHDTGVLVREAAAWAAAQIDAREQPTVRELSQASKE